MRDTKALLSFCLGLHSGSFGPDSRDDINAFVSKKNALLAVFCGEDD